MTAPDLRLAAVQALPLIPAYWLPYGFLTLLFPLRKGLRWRVGYAVLIFLLMTPKPVLDLYWLMYERARWISILQGVLMAVCIPLGLLVFFSGDWRPGQFSFFPFTCLHSVLILPSILLLTWQPWPLPPGRLLLVSGIFFAGSLVTALLSVAFLRRFLAVVRRLPGPLITVLAVLSPLLGLTLNMLQALEIFSGRTRAQAIVHFIPSLLAITAAFLTLLLVLLHRQNRQQLEIAAAYQAMQADSLQTQQANAEALRALQSEHRGRLRRLQTLLAENRADEALALLRQLTRQENRAVRRYADNPVADVVLAAADRRCREAGVPFTIQGALARDCPLPAADLASLLYNLLSNAAEAAALGPRPGDVTVRFSTVAGRLCVTVQNTAPPQGQRRRPGHGFGQQILRDIAARYDGSYTLTLENGRACAVAMVRLPAPNETEAPDAGRIL